MISANIFSLRNIVAAAVLLFVFVVILNPMLNLLLVSFRDGEGVYSFSNYFDAFSRSRQFTAYGNSLLLGVSVTIICLIFAVPFAWAVERTDIPLRNLFRYSVFGAFIIPPYLASVSWIVLMNPNSGWLNQLIMLLPFTNGGLFNAFTFSGLTFIIAVSSYPYLYIFTSTALDSVSSEMEDAANILGSGTLRTFVLITVPLVLPAIIAGSIVTFLEAISLVGTPALIAVPARLNLITIEIQSFFRAPIQVGAAAAYGMPLLVITVLLIAVQKIIIGRRQYTTITGKTSHRRQVRLGRWRPIVTFYCLFVVTITFLLPVALLHASFASAWFRLPSLSNFTLENYSYLIFTHQHAMNSVVNTVIYSAATATLGIFAAVVIAYLVTRKMIPGGQFLAMACLIPFVIPGIIIAIAVYATFAPPPFELYGTVLIMVIAFFIRFLPIAYLNANTAISRINPEMEDAVRILGGNRATALRGVTLPIIKKSLFAAWLLIFIVASRELSTAMFLYVPSTRPISITLLDLSEEGLLELLSALGMILLVITFCFVAVGIKVIGRDFMRPGGTK